MSIGTGKAEFRVSFAQQCELFDQAHEDHRVGKRKAVGRSPFKHGNPPYVLVRQLGSGSAFSPASLRRQYGVTVCL